MDIFSFLKKQPLLRKKSKSYTVKDFQFIKKLKDKDMPFLFDDKFLKLIDVIEAVISVQVELGSNAVNKQTKKIGWNVLDSNLCYGYYYGFCDAVITTTKFRAGMVELFYLWVNVIHRVTRVGNSPREFVDYFATIQTEFLKNKKCEFYKGCITGGNDAMDWMGEKSTTVMGLVTLLETVKKIEND